MSENITFLSDNAVSFSYTYSVNILNSEYFEDIEFAKTPNIDEMLDRNAEIRKGNEILRRRKGHGRSIV